MLTQVFVFLAAFVGFVFFAWLYKPNTRKSIEFTLDHFPDKWQSIIRANVPICQKLPTELRNRLHEKILTFLTEKTFVGQRGFVVTEKVKLIVAAQACLLHLGRNGPLYPLLDTIHVFEGAFNGEHVDGDDVELDIDHGRVIGLTWLSGPIALSWNHSAMGAYDPVDGHNVVIHEFAHQLDMESGFIDGVPVMEDADSFAVWCDIMQKEHQRLKTSVAMAKDRGENPDDTSLLNPYGTHSLEEFFAVATESFFEKPGPLQLAHPQLYEQFKLYYRVDPVSWLH